jgi:hypothetical protein
LLANTASSNSSHWPQLAHRLFCLLRCSPIASIIAILPCRLRRYMVIPSRVLVSRTGIDRDLGVVNRTRRPRISRVYGRFFLTATAKYTMNNGYDSENPQADKKDANDDHWRQSYSYTFARFLKSNSSRDDGIGLPEKSWSLDFCSKCCAIA